MRRESLVSEAISIGRTLCKSAYWHDGRCNWVGRSSREAIAPGVPLTPTVAALGPELYGGTSGVALFLAQLHARSPAEEFRNTALGATRQALWKGRDLPARVARGFFGGAIGIAYAATRVSLLLGEQDLLDDGLALARQAVKSDGDHLLDVISGNAGAIAPLFWLARFTGGADLHVSAVAFAEELAAAAITDGGMWRWDNDRACGAGVGDVPLCGLAHGASGMGLALIESGVHCGQREWIEGGVAAFRYEDQLFDTDHDNWPDLRQLGPLSGETMGSKRATFMVAWCHGAAGIGLARLRALRLLPDRAELKIGVQRALQTTAARLAAVPEEADASPCHGRAGLAETLLYAADVLNAPRHAAEVARQWTRSVRTRSADAPWPCGVASGLSTPSLMLGHAGIGYSLLRAERPRRTPSFLVIESPPLPG